MTDISRQGQDSTVRLRVAVPAGLTLVAFLYLLSQENFLLFHSLVELAAVSVGLMFVAVTLNLYPLSRNAFLAFLAIGLAWAGVVDLVHTLAYKGMGVFPGDDPNLPTQLWLVARFVEAGAIFLAPWFIMRSLRLAPAAIGVGAVVTALLVLVFTGLFPTAFVEGEGLTTFKVWSEYAVVGVLLLSLVPLYRRRDRLDPTVRNHVIGVILLTVGAEISFTLYVSVYGFSSFVGHIFKLGAYLLVYRVVVETMLMRPVEALSGLLPLCAGCKAVRGDDGTWEPLESYFGRSAGTSFSHGLCPQCSRDYYPDMFRENQ